MSDGPVIVVSDTHFGFESYSKDRFWKFLSWLATSDRKFLGLNGESTLEVPLKIILLGDILELWVPRDDDVSLAFKESFDNFTSLFDLSPKTEIIYVSGNHDNRIGSYADEARPWYPFRNGSRLCIQSGHYPNERSEKPGKKYKGDKIGKKSYFFLHGHQFDGFRFPAVLKLGDFITQNCQMSRAFTWLTWVGAAVLAFSVLVALFTNWLSLMFIWLARLLQNTSLLSFPVTVVLLLWGFSVFLGVIWVIRLLSFAYYEYTNHLGLVRRRSSREPTVDIKKLLDDRYYRPKKDTTDADVLVFGHTHRPEIRTVDVKGTKKLFVNSGSWIEYRDVGYDTFVYIDRDDPHLLQWDYATNSVQELKPTEGVVEAK